MEKKINIILLIVVFLIALFVVNIVYFKHVYLVIDNRENDYDFSNFLIYNYLLKVIGYFFKIGLVYLFFKFLLYIFDINNKIELLKCVILAEIVYLVCLKCYAIIYFFFIDSSVTNEFLLTYEKNLSLAYFLPSTDEVLYHFVGFATVFDIIFIITIVFLISKEFEANKYNLSMKIGLSYLILLFVVSSMKALLSL